MHLLKDQNKVPSGSQFVEVAKAAIRSGNYRCEVNDLLGELAGLVNKADGNVTAEQMDALLVVALYDGAQINKRCRPFQCPYRSLDDVVAAANQIMERGLLTPDKASVVGQLYNVLASFPNTISDKKEEQAVEVLSALLKDEDVDATDEAAVKQAVSKRIGDIGTQINRNDCGMFQSGFDFFSAAMVAPRMKLDNDTLFAQRENLMFVSKNLDSLLPKVQSIFGAGLRK